jgi:autotransporter-associated beta strand protein
MMSGNDAVGTSSFNSGLNWAGGATPVAGNTYQTSAFLLRTPANSTSLAFAGNSLEVQNGGDLRDKTSATITINDLILDNGGIFDMSGDGGVLAGNITLSGGMAYLSVGGGESFTCNSLISGPGGFYTYNAVSSGAGTGILTTDNTFTGGINVNAGTLQLNTSGGSTGLGGGNTTVMTSAILVGDEQDAFGYWPNVSPTNIFINGGTVTDLGSSSYRITLPDLTFSGGTLTSATGNNGDPNGNYSLFGVNGTCTVTTVSNNATAIISAAQVAIQSPTIFNVAAGNVTGGSSPGVDLLISSQLVPFGVQPVTKTGTGLMALTGANSFGGEITISGGTLQLGTTNDTAPLPTPLSTGAVVNNASMSFASSQTVTVSNVISGTGNLIVNNGTAILISANTFSGGTTVSNGLLLVNNVSGSGTGTGAVTVNSGGILGGYGTISGNVTVSGKTLPGTSAATNAFAGNLTYNFGAQADFDLSPAANGNGNDQIVLSGTSGVLTCGSAGVGIFLTGASLDEVNDYTLFNLSGSSAVISGNFVSTPVWLGATPANASSYSIITVGKKVLLHYNSNGMTNVPLVANVPASNVSFTSTTLNGQLISSGGQYPAITLYYGTNDGGTNTAAWTYSVSLGLQSGSFSATVSNLTANTTYYFTAAASNSAGTAWASPSQSFSTLALVQATVTNLPASNVQGNSAILNGQVLSLGNQTPDVNLYYGPTDGGTNAAAWANNIYLGQQTGNFSVTVTGLSTNMAYYYTAAAVNNAGTAWAAPSVTFTTLLTAPVVSVLTYHNDNARDGANTNETLLTPATVNTNNFGLLMSYGVDGFVFAQPLYVPNVTIPGQGTHNVVFVATENDSVYAFDADSNVGANGGLLWHTNLGIAPLSNNGEFGGRYHNGVYIDLTPEVGITGTPVIDPVSGTLYADVLSREVTATKTNYYHRIHALNITNGMEQPYSPVVVTASVPGTGVGGNGAVVTFNAQQQNQRPALTLAGGKLFVSYGSFADTDPYHGWIMAFNATNLVQLTNYIFNSTPNATTTAFGANAGEGALWMGGDGLCVDANTNLYFETANGSFSENTNGSDYGDSFVRLSTTNKLAVADYFTPYNQAAMQSEDSDLGSGGPMLLPDAVGSVAHPHLIVGGGKAGIIFLVDRDNMGTYSAATDRDVQEFGAGAGSFFCTPAYFNYEIYYQGIGSVMKAFSISNGVISTTPTSSSGTSFNGYGTTPSISANGTNNGIVWAIQTDGASPSDTGAGVLHAYNATNLSQELYNSSQNFARDNPGAGVKYSVPTVANGKVYVGAQYALSVFGYTAFLATPTISPDGEAYTNSVMVTLADATPGTAIYYTLDGTLPTTNSILYTGPFEVINTVNLQAVAAKSGAVNSGVASASFINTAALGNGLGLIGQYWTNTTAVAFTNTAFDIPPTLTRTDAVVNFNWSTNSPDPTVGQTNFAVGWTGSVQPEYSETYTFSTVSAGDVRLWVNGQLLIDAWTSQSSVVTNIGSLTLNAQQLYNLRMDYAQGVSNGLVQLLWSSPSTALSVIPQTQLYPYTNPPPTVILSAPVNGSTYTASASLTVGADADAPYNPINLVTFYANGNLLGTLSNSPDAPVYTLTATGLAAGTYALTAVATDGSGLSSTSAPVNITVAPGSGVPYGLTTNAPVPAFFNMPTTYTGTLPTLLSQTGVYIDTPNRIPAPGLIPYTPNTPLWSDNAVKSRYMGVPNSGGPLTPNQQIAFLPTNSWTFPVGTVFVKNFDMVVNQTNPAVPVQRLETRLLVRDINGMVYGVTYKWRPDDSDADLLTTSSNEVLEITNAVGVTAQTWYYPSPADCLTCHTPVANYVLGVNTRQLNGDLTYPATGNTDNQLRTLNRLGLFNPAFDEAQITNFEQLSAITNAAASFQQRSRSYLDANCAQCHQPGGTGITFDARYDTPLTQQNITNYPAAFNLGYDGACIVKADDVWRSMIWQRINTTNAATKMPPLARNLIDTNAVEVFAGWINSLPGTPALAPPVITPNGGSYLASVGVTLSPPDTNAAIYYTLDGSLPTTNSLLYSGAFTLKNNATVSASAFESGYDNSVAASVLFLVQPLNFTSEGFLANQQFQMEFTGVTGSNYVLQATTNFLTWTPISTNTAVTNLLNLVDPGATNYPYRFYRVVQE